VNTKRLVWSLDQLTQQQKKSVWKQINCGEKQRLQKFCKTCKRCTIKLRPETKWYAHSLCAYTLYGYCISSTSFKCMCTQFKNFFTSDFQRRHFFIKCSISLHVIAYFILHVNFCQTSTFQSWKQVYTKDHKERNMNSICQTTVKVNSSLEKSTLVN
jgi:hypothetical protein